VVRKSKRRENKKKN